MEWSAVTIRPFEFSAGATAAFNAEQDDAAIAGYYVSVDTFYSYPAYWASRRDANRRVVERRFHWLAGRWIMAVRAHGDAARSLDHRAVARDLLALATRYGLPAPPGWVSPTSTVLPQAATSTPTEVCTASFTDVPARHWAAGYITQLACEGVVGGYADGTFRPQAYTSRAQLVKMIVLAEGWSLLNPSQPTFADVGPGNVFYRYIETAYARGVVSGYANGYFMPYDAVTRAQVAKMLVRARGWTLQAGNPVRLCDVSPSYWAWDYIQTAIAHGIFTGYSDGCFRPEDEATRAQLAKLIVLARR
jgi:hypothetical protein